MPTILLRIFLVSNLLNTVLLYLIPKKLRTFLPHSWYPQVQQPPTGNLLHTTKTAAPPPPPTAARTQKMMDADDLRPVFQIFDRNGDGRITKEELSDSLGNMGIFVTDQEMTRMIEKVDANGDGCVDIDEFGVLYQSVMDDRGCEEAAAEEEEEEEEMREAFEVFDQDGDGFITGEELRSVLAALGLREGGAAAECGRMIAKVDVDGDGKVSFNEFKQMLMRGSGFAALS